MSVDTSAAVPLTAAAPFVAVPSSKSSSNITQWQRILYRKQPFPDNYVDTTFLYSLRKNGTHYTRCNHGIENLMDYDYTSLVIGAVSITQHMTSIALFLLLFEPMSSMDVLDSVCDHIASMMYSHL